MFHQLKCLLSSPRELCMIYVCEYADSFSTFALDYVFVLYLSMCFGLSDVEASWIYGIYGLMILLFGVFFGPLIDNLGIRYSLLLGSATSFFARFTLVFATDTTTLFATLLFLLPIGVSMTSNVLKLAVRRYTSITTRSFAFDGSYLVVNSAALSSAVLLTATRTMVPDYGQPYRPYLLLAALPGLLQFFLCFFLRELDVSSSSLVPYNHLQGDYYMGPNFVLLPSTVFKQVFSSPRLWRFLAISTLVWAGTGSILRHFGSTFPKTFTRSTSSSVPFELVLSGNPLVITSFLPFASPSLHAYKCDPYHLITWGCLISALSMFVLSSFPSVVGAVVGVVLFTIGEIIWAPRLLELSVVVGEEGREGTAMALSAIPRYIARLLAGASSGYLLQQFCSDAGHCQDVGAVWRRVGGFALLTPIALVAFKPYLYISQDNEEERVKLQDETLLSMNCPERL